MDGAGNVYLCTKEVLVHFKSRTPDMLRETIWFVIQEANMFRAKYIRTREINTRIHILLHIC